MATARRSRRGSRRPPVLVREHTVVADEWTLVDEGPARPGLIAPLNAWLVAPEGAGVWVDGSAEVDEVAPQVLGAPVVAVRFPTFADGRGLTFGALLRARYAFTGELRAIGEVVPDLTEYMYRCGFNAFALADRRQAEVAIRCMRQMHGHYQGSYREPLPGYGRHA